MDSQVIEAEEAFRQGRAAEALEALSRVLAAEPDHRRALRSLGSICHVMSLKDEAARAFGRLVELDPSDEAARRSLVVALMVGQAAPAEARPHLERLLAANQADAGLWLLLARLERAQDRPKAALEALERSLLINPAQPEAAAAAAGLRAAAGAAGAPPHEAAAAPRRLDWLGPPGGEDLIDPLLAPLAAERLKVNRVVSLAREAYFRAAAEGGGPLWLEGCGPITAALLADRRPLAGRRVILSLGRDEVLLESWRALSLEPVDDLVVESLYLRSRLMARLNEAASPVRPGARLHVVPRPASAAARAPSTGSAVAAPGPHGPLSGLMEVLGAFRTLSEARPDLTLQVGGPFPGPVWEAAAEHFRADPAMAAKVSISVGRMAPGAFLADKDFFLACPLAGEPPGLAEAARLGLGLLVRDAPGLGEVLGPERLWRTAGDLTGLLAAESARIAGRRDGAPGGADLGADPLRHDPAAVARRWLAILAAPAAGGPA
jgi:tetratricopeptide (TPR) repeat protein